MQMRQNIHASSFRNVLQMEFICKCTVEGEGPAERRLTGAGPRDQRGLESPGAEVGRCSLKDEGDRQGDKHGPLSTWWSLDFLVYFGLTGLLLLSVVLPSVSGPPSLLSWLVDSSFEDTGMVYEV
ncbi:hypothetical protein XENORESO_018992 [Xenotaenia resolanae]|uniref:Uncharacterized protein n=1 Tax=Xenotaenia resolanae TaxID=208358 RepID=A0ABV0VTS8_9TELE